MIARLDRDFHDRSLHRGCDDTGFFAVGPGARQLRSSTPRCTSPERTVLDLRQPQTHLEAFSGHFDGHRALRRGLLFGHARTWIHECEIGEVQVLEESGVMLTCYEGRIAEHPPVGGNGRGDAGDGELVESPKRTSNRFGAVGAPDDQLGHEIVVVLADPDSWFTPRIQPDPRSARFHVLGDLTW